MARVAELAAMFNIRLDPQFEFDEIELGERVALALDDPLQTIHALYQEELWMTEPKLNCNFC